MRVEILGDERRRRWSDKSKLEVVLSVGVDSASVTEVARRYSVTRQQVYTWRRELRKKGLLSPRSTTVFLPLPCRLSRTAKRLGLLMACRFCLQ